MDEEKRFIISKKVLAITIIIINISVLLFFIYYMVIDIKSLNILLERHDAPYRSDVVFASEELVRSRLKAPETAEFPPWHSSDVTCTELGKNRYEVMSYFDVENAHGDVVRTHYVAVLKYEGNDRWTLESLEFN